jgi:hypothetical protein
MMKMGVRATVRLGAAAVRAGVAEKAAAAEKPAPWTMCLSNREEEASSQLRYGRWKVQVFSSWNATLYVALVPELRTL